LAVVGAGNGCCLGPVRPGGAVGEVEAITCIAGVSVREGRKKRDLILWTLKADPPFYILKMGVVRTP